MPSRTTLLALMIALGAVACAPPALDADHASNASAESGSSKSKSKSKTAAEDADDDDDTSADDDVTAPASKKESAPSSNGGGAADTGAAPASFAAVYSGLEGTCASCHLSGAGGAPVFFGDTAASSYPQFKDMNFATDPSPLSTKGAHSGPALTTQQDSAISAWVAEEQ